jgi:hypothetical protein
MKSVIHGCPEILLYSVLILLPAKVFTQQTDPCGWEHAGKMHTLAQEPGWGYPYDSLITDLQGWAESPYVTIDSAGASVQDRALWLLTIQDTVNGFSPRWRITIHARTHPGEVQSTWVTNEMIDLLLTESSLARDLRANCVFNILPMYNPDGVELGYARVNANEIDLERNWDDEIQEPEAAVLKHLFETYMNSEIPIRIALNMHSAFACTRYFVYHHENGTSPQFAEDEKQFIGSVKQQWPEGIEDWNYYVSWTGGTPPYYPESWFWMNFAEQVMALTYEDMNCAEAGDFDRTATALLQGIFDYLSGAAAIRYVEYNTEKPRARIFPNPLPSNTRLSVLLPGSSMKQTRFALYNVLGQKLHSTFLNQSDGSNSVLALSLPYLPVGVYYLQIARENMLQTLPVYIVR